MSNPRLESLSRRERQIMNVLFRRGEATVAEVVAELPEPPTESAVRSALWLLEERGHVTHEQRGPRNVYRPAVAPERARRTAARQLIDTFFRGSRAQAVSAILDASDARLSDEELDEIGRLVEQARARRRGR